MFLGFNKNEKKTKTMKTIDDIGQMLVCGALDDTKKMGSRAAERFPKASAGQKQSGKKKTKKALDFPHVSRERWLS